MPRNAQYDFNEMIKEFNKGTYARERIDLFAEFNGAVAMLEPPLRHLLSEVAEKALQQSAGPVACLKLGLIYGLTLGVLLEKHRTKQI